MKKLLSLCLTLIMLALPVISLGGEAAAPGLALNGGFGDKYTAEGQRVVAEFSIEPGSGLVDAIPEQMRAAVQDLLNALKIQVVSQKNENGLQGALRLILNGNTAADVTAAVNDKGIFAGSSFLGDQIIQLTADDLKTLGKQITDQMVQSGQLKQEDVDALFSQLQEFSANPQDALAKLIGNPDASGLISALTGLIPTDAAPVELTEKPEGVDIDAKYEITIVLKKEAIRKVTDEAAKLLWSMPGVQKIITAVAEQQGKKATEDKLIKFFGKVSDKLAEDVTLKVYMTEDQSTIQILSDIGVRDGEKILPVSANLLIEPKGNEVHMLYTISAEKEAKKAVMTGDMRMTMDGPNGTMEYDIRLQNGADGSLAEAMHETVSAAWTGSDTERTFRMDVAADVPASGDAAPVSLKFEIASSEKDLGDHAESTLTIKPSMGGMGELFTLRADVRTDLAEASIATDGAVRIMSLSEEERQTFKNGLQNSLMTGLGTLLQNLPDSTKNLVTGLMGTGSTGN